MINTQAIIYLRILTLSSLLALQPLYAAVKDAHNAGYYVMRGELDKHFGASTQALSSEKQLRKYYISEVGVGDYSGKDVIISFDKSTVNKPLPNDAILILEYEFLNYFTVFAMDVSTGVLPYSKNLWEVLTAMKNNEEYTNYLSAQGLSVTSSITSNQAIKIASEYLIEKTPLAIDAALRNSEVVPVNAHRKSYGWVLVMTVTMVDDRTGRVFYRDDIVKVSDRGYVLSHSKGSGSLSNKQHRRQ